MTGVQLIIANYDVFMISYVIPYYTQSGEFLGVIGMDIDFNKIVRFTQNVSIYDTGKLDLIDFTNQCIYTTDSDDSVVCVGLMAEWNDNIAAEAVEGTFTLSDENGTKIFAGIGELSNGMKLMLYVPVSEINAERNQMLLIFAVLAVLALGITIIIIIQQMNMIVRPLKELTRITDQYANGDWNEIFRCETGDEIQRLADSIYVMAATTKSYIKKINDNATIDALTGLKNKNCYLSFIEKYKTDKDTEEYGVVVFDINYMKKINDQYGHEMGDVLIQTATKYICDIFEHSPAFRIGGDEFVVLLENRDYQHRKELCEQFETELKDVAPIIDDFRLSLAYGMAVYREDGTEYDDVFCTADERMYEYKKAMKAARE